MKHVARHIAIMASLLALAGCGGRIKPEAPLRAAAVLPSQTINGFRLVETVMGRKSWVLDADSANTFSELQTVELFKLKLDFYRKAGDSVLMVVTSDQGTINTASRDVEARQHVVVVTRDSLKIFTEQIRWNNRKRRLVTDVHVRLEKGADWLEGDGLEASPDGREVQLMRNVRGKKELLDFDGLKWD